uniref:Chitin-binding type-2 domain-containing protein n=1 Tax=Clytia hemisphaerica TaxID=252671 RepID=A0A7M5WSN9_9CNID
MVKLFIFLFVLIAEKIAVNGLPESLTGGLKDKRSAFFRKEIQNDEEQTKCAPGIKRFSSLDERKYYSCEEGNGYAVLKTCPGNQLYWPQKEICYQPDEDETQGGQDVRVRRASSPPANNKGRKATIIKRKLLRSDVSLGEFYDAKNDQFLSGVSLWSMEELEKHRKRRFARPSTNYQFDSGKTEDSRMNLMDIDASLKLSFMGGLIEVSGSAQYVRQSDVLTTDETFTLAYKSTSFYNVLPVTAVKNFPKQCDNKQATHVVSKVVYGQNAYYFFKRSVSRKEKKEKIAGSLQVLVKAIPAFSIEGSATVKVEGEEKRFRESVKVRFNGDFKLPGGFPATFEEAVKSFKKLQDYTAQPPDYVNAVPVEVQLTPIQDFCDATDTILVSIGDSLTQKTAEMLSHFNVLSMEINTLLNSGPAFEYPVIRENLNLYKINLNSKLLKIKEKLQTLLPDIRAGKEGAKELNNLLVEANESPFEFVKSEAFLNSRSLEIRALNLLTDGFNEYSLKNFRVADFKQPTRAQIMMNYLHVVVLDVNILQSKQITQKFLQNEKINSSFWYNNDAKASELGKQKKLFKNFLEANQNSNKFGYLISINLRDEDQPIRVQAKRSGVADSLDFIIPDVRQIGKPKVTFVSYDHFKISVTKPNNTWVTHFLVEYWSIIDD